MIKDNKNNHKPVKYRSELSALWPIIGLVIVLAVAATSWQALSGIKDYIKLDIANKLETILHTTNNAMNGWAEDRKRAALNLTKRPDTQRLFKSLLATSQNKTALKKNKALKVLREIITPYLDERSDLGFFLISRDHINVASMRDENLGIINLLSKEGDYLDNIFNGKAEIVLPMRSDVLLPGLSGDLTTNEPTMFVGVPVYSADGEVAAAFAIRIDPSLNFTRIAQVGRLGRTGDPYGFDTSGRLITESRFNEDLRTIGLLKEGAHSILSIAINDPGGDMTTGFTPKKAHDKLPLTKMAASATSGKDGTDIDGYRDYRGVDVVGSWLWNNNLNFGLAIEINVSEAYSTYNSIRKIVLTVIIVTIALFTIFTFSIVSQNFTLSREVLERRRLSGELLRLATTDIITGAYNRAQLDEIISKEIERSLRFDHPLSLIVFDIDHFKKINDTYGHTAGDVALKSIAKIVRTTLRSTDHFIRWGGEEFILVTSETDINGAKDIAERIRKSVEDFSFGESGKITISFGVTTLREGDDRESMVIRADKALYAAKDNGRNRVETIL
ncbi:MAG: diguanylate cyclase [Deltaproteobacteria bacterium]|nr:diguanylate cyclase [Deltaproteobacteria bacterium]